MFLVLILLYRFLIPGAHSVMSNISGVDTLDAAFLLPILSLLSFRYSVQHCIITTCALASLLKHRTILEAKNCTENMEDACLSRTAKVYMKMGNASS